MSRLALLVALALAACGIAVSGAGAAPAKKREIVCFMRTATAKDGRTVRRRVCRPRRRAAARRSAPPAAPAPAPQPAAPAAGAPAPAAPAAPSAPPAAGFAGDAILTPPPPCSDDSPWLAFTADDPLNVGGRLWTTKACARAGTLLVQLRNLDAQPHNVWVAPPGGGAPHEVVADVAEPQGQTPSAGQGSVDVTPGEWRFFCAIPGHATMTRTLTVTRGS